MIPPIYILITVAFTRVETRAKYFGLVSGAAGLGAAAGPLIGGLVTSAISWRASFVLQFLIVAAIVRARPPDQRAAHAPAPAPHFDLGGAALSALGLFFVVFGVLQSSTYGWGASRKDFTIGGVVIIPKGSISPVWLFFAVGVVLLAWCAWHLHRVEAARVDAAGVAPAVPQPRLEPRVAHPERAVARAAGLVLRDLAVPPAGPPLQRDRDRADADACDGRHPAGVGRRRSGWHAAGRRACWSVGGFVLTVVGMALLLALVRKDSNALAYLPGLLLIGLGVGIMLTASVNVVQSSFSDTDQGDISGVSRSVSNLGSSLGVALAGSVLVGAAKIGLNEYAIAIVVLGGVALIGLGAAMLLPKRQPTPVGGAVAEPERQP